MHFPDRRHTLHEKVSIETGKTIQKSINLNSQTKTNQNSPEKSSKAENSIEIEQKPSPEVQEKELTPKQIIQPLRRITRSVAKSKEISLENGECDNKAGEYSFVMLIFSRFFISRITLEVSKSERRDDLFMNDRFLGAVFLFFIQPAFFKTK